MSKLSKLLRIYGRYACFYNPWLYLGEEFTKMMILQFLCLFLTSTASLLRYGGEDKRNWALDAFRVSWEIQSKDQHEPIRADASANND